MGCCPIPIWANGVFFFFFSLFFLLSFFRCTWFYRYCIPFMVVWLINILPMISCPVMVNTVAFLFLVLGL
ncbi:hypothetical protein HOY80DRAFT_700195 [Tuber brumale]|nr:hypothetical protein HOY80DRAFT_700195 [Tuber brumale]